MREQTYRITTKDTIGGERTWLVRDVADEDDARRQAAKTAALDHIEAYEDYGSDSAYLDDLDAAADAIEVLSASQAPGLIGGRPIATGVWLLDKVEPNDRTAVGMR